MRLKAGWTGRRSARLALSATLATAALVLVALPIIEAFAQSATQRRGRQIPVKPLPEAATVQRPATDAKAADTKAPPEPEERVEADVSTRNVSVTSSFTGTEIVVFGSVDNSRQPSPEAGTYDVVVVIEGVPAQITVRKKSRVGGIWLNTPSATATFDGVPTYYAIASTRPLDELAPEATLIGYEVGFDHVRMTPLADRPRLPAAEMKEFREAVIRLKQKDGLYVAEPHGVTFIGRSLFRATIALPATVSVGPFDTRVYLFRSERLISQYNVRINLEREGLERFLHTAAFQHPFVYGLATVLLAIAAGMIATTVFSKGGH